MDCQSVIRHLREKGLLSAGDIQIAPLGGGVSSEIYLLNDGLHKLVVKQALAKLRVQEEWSADPFRNQFEQEFIRYASGCIPNHILPIIMDSPTDHLFVMEFLGGEFATWKQTLLGGQFDPKIARTAAQLLGTFHAFSWNDPVAQERFETDQHFYALRIDPYLITTGQRNPPLRDYFEAEATRLMSWRQALVHGDFSPKNIMVSQDRLVLLDHEVAWFGDPAFDLAFLLNHLFLKSLLFARQGDHCLQLGHVVWEQYFQTVGVHHQAALNPRVSRLLLLLMLARLDGKSPIEYLIGKEKERRFVRTFVYDLLPVEKHAFDSILNEWSSRLAAP